MSGGANEFTTGTGFLRALEGETNAVTEMLTLAVAMADQAARFDIEFGCCFVTLNSGEWIDTTQPSKEVEALAPEARMRYGIQLARAMRYLELRGQVVRCPSFEKLIRFATPEALH